MRRITFLLFVCFYAPLFEAQNLEWVAGIGGEGNSIAVDALGNVYSTGDFNTTSDFDPDTAVYNLTPFGSDDIFVSKLDSLGSFIWVKQIGGSMSDWPYSIVVDGLSNIYITGRFEGTADFDPGPGNYNLTSFGNSDVFVCKLDPSGDLLWVKQFGGSLVEAGRSVTLDVHGNIYTIGSFNGTADFDPGSGIFNLTSLGGLNDIFISKLDPSGNFLFARQIGGSGGQAGMSVVVDKAGNIYSTGSLSDTTDFDPGLGVYNLISTSLSDIFISKIDSFGNLVWAKQIEGSSGGYSLGLSAALDSSGNFLLTGQFEGMCDFDPGSGIYNLTSFGDKDMFVCKIDSQGNLVWVRQMGGLAYSSGFSIFVDAYGSIYNTGSFSGTVDFDPGPGTFNLTSAGSGDIFINKLDTTGNFDWAKQIGNTSTDYGNQVVVDLAGNIYTTGHFQYIVDFDPGVDTFALVCSGSFNSFVHRLSQNICSGIVLVVDSASGISCSQTTGFSSSFVMGAQSPYTFQWSTSPVTFDSVAYFSSGGTYTLILTDSNNCIVQRNVLIDNGPRYSGNFDLDAHLVSTPYRPGFASYIWINSSNNGCTPVSGSISVILNSLINYNSAIPIPDLISGDTLTWNFSNITYDSLSFTPQIFVTISSSAVIGDTLCCELLINPISGDADSTNNYKTYCFPVVNAYDPNDKQVFPAGACPDHFVFNSQKLAYTIRFQNTGNSNAININVLDSLDSDLDLSSVRVIASSHSLITEVLPGNVLKFRFDNIMLPDSASNEPASHGYVIYEVDPLPGATDGTEIKNHADIYFDFNPPVITNTTLNTLVSVIPNCTIATEITESDESGFKIYPNPAEDVFFVDNIQVNSAVYLYDISGRLILAQKSNSSKCAVNTSSLQNGIYLVEVGSGGLSNFQRIVINR